MVDVVVYFQNNPIPQITVASLVRSPLIAFTSLCRKNNLYFLLHHLIYVINATIKREDSLLTSFLNTNALY